jgi:hypothetical protein
MEALMLTATIGDTLAITRPNGTTETYVLEGGREVIFRDRQGVRHTRVLHRDYVTVRVIARALG